MKRLTDSKTRTVCDGKNEYQADLYNRLAEIEDWIEEETKSNEYDLKDYCLVKKLHAKKRLLNLI